MYPSVQTFKNQVQCFLSDSRKSASKSIRPDQHYRPDRRSVKRIADADCVADDYIPLQQFDLFKTDDLVLERAETRGDAVSDLSAFEQRINGVRRPLDIRSGTFRQNNAGLAR